MHHKIQIVTWDQKYWALKMKCNKQKNQWVHNFHITSIILSMTRARFRLLFNPYKECKYMYTYRLWSLKYTNTSYTQWEDRQFLFLTFTVMHSITIYSQYSICWIIYLFASFQYDVKSIFLFTFGLRGLVRYLFCCWTLKVSQKIILSSIFLPIFKINMTIQI